MSLKIIKAGLLDTIQDLGRFGYQHLGVNPGGVMDRYSAQVSNLLIGNNFNDPVIEMHFPAAELLFEKPALIAMSGADFQTVINGTPVPINRPLVIGENSRLQFQKKKEGERVYLAIKGLQAEQWLSSNSTHLKIRAGGYLGRAFLKSDPVEVEDDMDYTSQLGEKHFIVLPFTVDLKILEDGEELFVLPGREWGWLTDEQKKIFISSEFAISKAADRMGYQLEGPAIHIQGNEELVSTGVSFGTIQLIPNGQLIILMADHQSTGGYPRIAHVAMVHTSRLAQMGPGKKIRFKVLEHQTAEQLLIDQYQHLLQLKNACKFRLKDFFS